MDPDLTQFQSPDDLEKAEKLSREGGQPPAEVPGIDIQVLIGSGAYGEVWSGIDRNTGRKVAIKFYSRRSSVDFSLLTREVEKLASLAADRYVVQLLDVGWDASPPFYVMDFIENGSLEDELRRRGPFSIDEATEMFHEVSIGLMHLHNKGILHCDLKPGNVLLDTDMKPRLADFGQSRLSSEQAPALGTLFYMAPEQANLEAIPDAKWDVFALGALMYCMLTGSPPYRTSEITEQLESAAEINDRLKRYQKALKTAPPPKLHRNIPGIDKPLVEIIDRCIAVDSNRRFENVQSVLLSLRQREESRARRPLMVLGLIGPIILLIIMSVFGMMLYNRSMEKAENSLLAKARESNEWAAQFASRTATDEIDKFFSSVYRLANDPEFIDLYKSVLLDPELSKLRNQLTDPNAAEVNREKIKSFLENEVRQKLQEPLQRQIDDETLAEASWFVSDPAGTQIAFASEDNNFGTIGKNYCWRTYFSGRSDDQKETRDGADFYDVPDRPEDRDHITRSHMSAIFISQATNRWKIAFSMPIYDGEHFLGVVAATVHCSDLVSFEHRVEQYAMLVDFRECGNQGAILGHPIFEKYTEAGEKIPNELRYETINIENTENVATYFQDPLSQHYPEYGGNWVLGKRPIHRTVFDTPGLTTQPTGLFILALEDADSVMRPVNDLGRQILILGLISIVTIILVGVGLWILAIRGANESRERVNRVFRSATETATIANQKSTHEGSA